MDADSIAYSARVAQLEKGRSMSDRPTLRSRIRSRLHARAGWLHREVFFKMVTIIWLTLAGSALIAQMLFGGVRRADRTDWIFVVVAVFVGSAVCAFILGAIIGSLALLTEYLTRDKTA